MSDKFCKALSNAVSFRIPGNSKLLTFNPCCAYDKYIPFHPTMFQRMRKIFTTANDFLPECSKCKLREITHGASLRTNTNENIPDGIGNEIYKLEIVVDTTCNAACIQCGGTQSSLWRKELSQNKKIHHIQTKSEIDSNIDKIAKAVDLSTIKTVHFWGGEPLLTDTHLKVLSLFKNYEEMDLIYTTNCSIFPDENILNLWSKFKKVRLGLSIDGINEKFHYIRWPLSWEKITKNLELFKKENSVNLFFHINYCVMPLNAYYVDELDSWIKNNFSHAMNGSQITYNFIKGEGTLDIAHTPIKLREKIWEHLSPDHPVSNILKEVPVIDHKSMIEHLDNCDDKRNLNWREIFKEVAPYF